MDGSEYLNLAKVKKLLALQLERECTDDELVACMEQVNAVCVCVERAYCRFQTVRSCVKVDGDNSGDVSLVQYITSIAGPEWKKSGLRMVDKITTNSNAFY